MHAAVMRSLVALTDCRSTREVTGFGSGVLRWIWICYTWRLTQAGRWFVWPTIGFIAYTSTSLEYQSYTALAYVFALWLFAAAVALLCRPRVRVEINHEHRACAGEVLPVEVAIEPQGWWRRMELFVQPHRLPPGVAALDEHGAAVPAARSNGPRRVTVGLRCVRRGTHQLQGFRVETDFPFGLLRAWRSFPHQRTLLIYPHFHPLKRLEIPAGRRYQPGGVALASVTGDSAEFVGDRDFRDGDNVRDMDWVASARLSRLIVREYRQEYFLRVAVILDTHVPADPLSISPLSRGRRPADERSECFERAVSLSAAVGEYLARQEYIVDIFAAGPNLYHLLAGRSLAYLDQILDILACVDKSPVEPFDIIAPELMENLSRISAVICIFLDWNETRRQFVQRLREQGVGLKVIVVRSGELAASDGACDFVSAAAVDAGIEEL